MSVAGGPAHPMPRLYVCRACGRGHAGYTPRCTGCDSWDLTQLDDTPSPPGATALQSIDAVPEGAASSPRTGPGVVRAAVDPAAPILLCDVEEEALQRDSTNIPQLDAVLGGGLVVGTVLVLGGEPGCGKSSLAMQAIDGLAIRVLYATGEESVKQAAARARRIDAASHRVYIVAETDLDTVLAHARAVKAELIVIDSIQTLVCADLGGTQGSPGQVRECTNRLVRFAKTTDVSVWLIGHVTNDGALAGPKTLKHLVDVVLELENTTEVRRLLRCAGKNRFGPSNVIGRFEVTARGLIEVEEEPEFDEEAD
jgi:DNA repair protein RadA/Sms